MFSKGKKPIPDPEDLEKFRRDVQILQAIEDGLKTVFGKYVLEMIRQYKTFAMDEFTSKNVSEMDDMQTMAWTYSIRGKIQLLNDIEKRLLSAKDDKEALIKELKQYSA